VSTLATSGITLHHGDRVVFTGDMHRPRSEWEAACRAVGLEPSTVTKATRVVVAADPNSRSGKASKARSYGIPIITEEAFERLLLAQAPALV
jgi:DNA polymerase-3 subunit epsilon